MVILAMELWTGDLTSLSILSRTRGTAHRQPHEAGKDRAHTQCRFFVEAFTSLPMLSQLPLAPYWFSSQPCPAACR